MSDVEKYARKRAERDPEFAEHLNTKKSAISRIENHAGDIRLSTLERYAEALGWTVSVDLRPPEGAPGRRSARLRS